MTPRWLQILVFEEDCLVGEAAGAVTTRTDFSLSFRGASRGLVLGVEDGPRQRLQVLVLPVHHGHRRPRHEGSLRVRLGVGSLVRLGVPEVEVVLAGLQQRLQPRHHRGEGGPVVGGEVPALQHQVVPAAAACVKSKSSAILTSM